MLRIIFLIITVLCLSGCGQGQADTQNNSDINTGFIGEREPVTRAEVAKMLALSRYSPDEINNLERIITFNDTDVSMWYDKYINAAYTAKLISGTSESDFTPEDNLTLAQAQILVKKVNASGNFELKFNLADKDKPISYKIWLEAFTKAAGNSVTSCDIFVYATGQQCKELGDRYIICNGGLRGVEGIDFSEYNDKIISVVMKENEVIGVSKIVNTEPVLKGAEIVSSDNNNITVKLNGASRRFKVDDENAAYNVGDKIDIAFDKDGKYQISKSAT